MTGADRLLADGKDVAEVCRVLLENEVLPKAAAYFARENVLPNSVPGGRATGRS
ncbi:hypothetical protein [Nocardia sp. NPDC004750]